MRKWYECEGAVQDIVMSTRVRFARNLRAYPFPNRMTQQQKREVCALVKDALANARFAQGSPLRFIDMGQLDDVQALSLVERHLVSPEFVKNAAGRGLLLSEDESVSIMICEEDHIRIQVIAAGLALRQALDTAGKIDDIIDSSLEYAFHEKLGFLTQCPTNLGTGLRASVMLHLPTLEQMHAIGQLDSTVSKLGLTIRGTYGENSKPVGAFYQLSNQVTLGISEETAIQNLEGIAKQIIEKEKSARSTFVQSPEQFEDRVWRSVGILTNARLLSSTELMELSSNVRLGVSMGVVRDVSVPQLNRLLSETGAATIQSKSGRELTPTERDKTRADIVRAGLRAAPRSTV